MRDYRQFDAALSRLTGDVYAQPPDPGHTAWATEALEWLLKFVEVPKPVRSRVLDIGCGQAFMCGPFERAGMDWTGVTIGDDVAAARSVVSGLGLDPQKVREADMTFLPFDSGSFDLIFARHVLEHSPFPILSLMEWRRLVHADAPMLLVAPAPDWWGYRGRNHYAIAPLPLLNWWCMRAGWNPVQEFTFSNRDPQFLEHLEVYQSALQHHGRGIQRAEQVLEAYPPGAVEFRLLCRAAAEVDS